MWPFKTKAISKAVNYVIDLKSLSLPETNPSWRLFAQSQSNWDISNAIVEGVNASAVAYACMKKRASLVSSVPLVVEVKRGDEWEAAPDSELQRLLDAPNPAQGLREFISNCVLQLDLSGNAFISEIKAGMDGLPVELWVLPSINMRITAGRASLIDSYEFINGATRETISSDDMVQLMFPNPESQIFGRPTLKDCAVNVDIDREASEFQKVSFKNRGLTDISVELPEGATQQQSDAVRDALAKRQTGSANARKPIVTTGKVNVLGDNAKEMDFVESRKSNMIEICAAFGMSLANLGMTENVNLANGKEMQKALWVNTIIPLLDLILDQMNRQLTPEFGEEYRIVKDLSNVAALQQDLNEKLEAAERLHRMGVPFNTINQKLELGVGDIEGGDIGYIPTGMLPVGFEPDMTDDEDIDNDTAKSLAYGVKKCQ